MKTLLRHMTVTLLGLLMITPFSALQAQNKAVATISVAPLQKIFADVKFIAAAAGQAETGDFLPFMAAPFIAGVNKSKPIGAVVMTDGQAFWPLVFLPVDDLDAFLVMPQEEFGEAEDAGDGVKMLEVPAGPGGTMPAFFKAANGWVFMSQDKEKLANLPADPASLLGELPKNYDFSISGNLENVPGLYKDIILEQIVSGAETALIQEPDETEEEFAQRKALVKKQVAQFERLLNEFKDMTIGWNVDPTTKSTYLDISFSVLPGTQMAKQIELNKDLTSDFASMVDENSAISMHMAAKVSPDEIATVSESIENIRTVAISNIELPEGEQRDAAIKALNLVLDSYVATVKTGKIDLAAKVELGKGKMTFVSGGKVADGRQIEDSVKELVKLLEDNPKFPGITWNADSHKGINFHSMKVPLPMDKEEKANEIFGDEIEVILGIGDQSVYFVFGSDAASELKGAIDKSIANGSVPADSLNMTIALKPIFEFVKNYQENDPNVEAGLAALQGTADKVIISAKLSSDTSVIYRFSLEEGVIKAIGAAAAAEQGGGGDVEFEFEAEAEPALDFKN